MEKKIVYVPTKEFKLTMPERTEIYDLQSKGVYKIIKATEERVLEKVLPALAALTEENNGQKKSVAFWQSHSENLVKENHLLSGENKTISEERDAARNFLSDIISSADGLKLGVLDALLIEKIKIHLLKK